MLPKNSRLTTQNVDEVFKNGRFAVSPSFTFKYILKNKGNTQISVIAPKSVAKLAVKRNSLRRKAYNSLRKNISIFPPLLGALVFKKGDIDTDTIEHEINTILSKIH
jgi:ribonuclease P protein component